MKKSYAFCRRPSLLLYRQYLIFQITMKKSSKHAASSNHLLLLSPVKWSKVSTMVASPQLRVTPLPIIDDATFINMRCEMMIDNVICNSTQRQQRARQELTYVAHHHHVGGGTRAASSSHIATFVYSGTLESNKACLLFAQKTVGGACRGAADRRGDNSGLAEFASMIGGCIIIM